MQTLMMIIKPKYLANDKMYVCYFKMYEDAPETLAICTLHRQPASLDCSEADKQKAEWLAAH